MYALATNDSFAVDSSTWSVVEKDSELSSTFPGEGRHRLPGESTSTPRCRLNTTSTVPQETAKRREGPQSPTMCPGVAVLAAGNHGVTRGSVSLSAALSRCGCGAKVGKRQVFRLHLSGLCAMYQREMGNLTGGGLLGAERRRTPDSSFSAMRCSSQCYVRDEFNARDISHTQTACSPFKGAERGFKGPP
ncbi:hypothetical protein TGME49_201160 [Toxoplasma gondii ME49]|uniref:Uncharacterized protein n=1 Tax=Toxoplasma gondii (strain ATCC 50611 / Me49) TaxID=508771 RepID=S8F3J4_TOXGM|nr:hypothetical protein TGME49_201160 [Toxoplasma gondii ME49]EPT30316.1 hypothetical protein TGME49_201160 [Toxoplasma gondii ME49]|eukprot:XP_002367442.1 hypothetical protein TGME49_201160 [Toxoplasma gondii ME49]